MAASDARPVPRKNVAYRATFPILDADGDLVAGAAGLDSEISKDGGTFADCTNEATQIATDSGVYYLDLTADEMNADTVSVIVKTSTTGAKTTVLVLYPEEAGDYRADVTQISGDATAADNLEAACDGGTYNLGGGAIVAASVTAAVTAGTVSDKTGYALTAAYDAAKTAAQAGDAMTLAAGAITAAVVATGAIDADALAVDAVAEIADGVWDEALAGHTVAGSAGAGLTVASSAGDPWATALPGAYSAGTAGKIVGDNLNATISSRAVAGDAMTLAAGAVSAAAIATGAIDADAFAADAVTELQAGLATSADIAALNDLTGNEIADAVLARDLGSGTAAGTLNERTVRSALRVLRNKWSVSAGTLTATKEDDTTTAWTATVTSATGADPVTAVDPA